MHSKLIGALATLVALGAAAPHSGQQKAILSPAHSLVGDACWGACFPQKLSCPESMVSNPECGQVHFTDLIFQYPEQLGECWTCCDKEAGEVVKAAMKSIGIDNQICLRVCFPVEPKCADGWVSVVQLLIDYNASN